MNVEWQLKELLKRREPPPGFAGRVMARMDDSGRPQSTQPAAVAHLRHRVWRALAAAAVIVLVMGAWGVHATLRARDQLRLALHITAEKVADAQQQVRSGSR